MTSTIPAPHAPTTYGPDAQAWDAVVIGSGVGGLTTAAYLATNGKRVLVLEGTSVIGGSAQEFKRNKVFKFASGAHYVGDCERDGIIPTALRGVGLEDVIRFNPMDKEEFDRIIAGDFDFRVPRGWDAFEDKLIESFPDDARGIRRTLRTLRQAAEAIVELDGPPVPGPVKLLRNPRQSLAVLRAGMTLKQLFDLNRLSPQARAAISYINIIVGVSSDRLPAAIYAAALNHYIVSGGWFVRGGVDRIPHGLARVIRCHGGEIRTSQRVAKILVDRGRAYGVRLADGTEIHAATVVSNADIKTTYADLIDHEHTGFLKRKWIERAPLTLSLFSVYLGVDIDLREHLPAQNIWGMSSTNYDRLFGMLTSGQDPFESGEHAYWFTSQTLKDDPEPGTEGYSSIEICSATPATYEFWGLDGGVLDGVDYHRDPRYLARKKAVEDIIIEKVLADHPFLEGHIVWRESSTMLSQEDWTLSRMGAWAGLDFSLPNILFRPGPSTEIKGLYLTGASSSSFGAMYGTLRGGVETAGAILGRDLWQQVKRGTVFGHGLTDTAFATTGRAPGFHRLPVRAIDRQTADSVVIEFDVPAELRDAFAFEPGQNVTVRGEAAGEQIRRSYSICEPATTGRLRIGVKSQAGGVFSPFAVERVQPGDLLDVGTPRGTFTTAACSGPGHYAAIAAGSGVTPIMSIIATVLATEPDSSFTLLYGNRTVESTMFRSELDELCRRYPERLRVTHHLSRADDEVADEPGQTFRSGRLDHEALTAHLADGLNPTRMTAWFLCGPTGLVQDAETALGEHGVDPATIHLESFDSTPKPAQPRIPGPPSTVTLNADARTTVFSLARNSDTLLDAAIRLRDDLPYSCLSGSCGSCLAHVSSGDVEMDDDPHAAITADQIDRGYVLTCLARPTSDDVAIDFDR